MSGVPSFVSGFSIILRQVAKQGAILFLEYHLGFKSVGDSNNSKHTTGIP